MHTDDVLLTTPEVAELAGKHRSTVTRWVQSGRLKPAHRTPGGMLLFSPTDVRSLMDEDDQ